MYNSKILRPNVISFISKIKKKKLTTESTFKGFSNIVTYWMEYYRTLNFTGRT